jgi:3-deoxy-manno-octulosonate cytidylyltransferase (CMP-KDO synthetase)
MADKRVLGVIPARLGSERLPRKPLYRLAGKPLIEWVWSRVHRFRVLDRVVVATDAEPVAEACRNFGAEVELTSPDHASGTDRVAEVATRPSFMGYDVIINIQGDEPFVEPGHVEQAADLVLQGWDVGTVAAPVGSLADWHDPAVVKVVRRDDGGALYFSRSPIPFRRGAEPDAQLLSSPCYLRHIGVYAYRRQALLRWVELPESDLEQLERLEQLRALAGGLTIGVGVVEAAEPGIDTPADAARAEARLLGGNSPLSTEPEHTGSRVAPE